MSKRTATAFEDDDDDDVRALLALTPVQNRPATQPPPTIYLSSSSSSGSSYAPSQTRQPKKPNLSNHKQTSQRRHSAWTEIPNRGQRPQIPNRVEAPSNIAQRLRRVETPVSEDERLAACYAALTKQSAVQSTYKCPLPSVLPRAPLRRYSFRHRQNPDKRSPGSYIAEEKTC